jgi:PhnB protein
MEINAYLFFDGRCEEAVEFYRRKLGAEVNMLMRYKDSPEPPPGGKADPNAVMHASLRIGDTVVLASDDCQGHPKFDGFALTITVPNEAEADRVFGAITDGGKVTMPLGKTFFAKSFGMANDRFGVHWMVIAPAERP